MKYLMMIVVLGALAACSGGGGGGIEGPFEVSTYRAPPPPQRDFSPSPPPLTPATGGDCNYSWAQVLEDGFGCHSNVSAGGAPGSGGGVTELAMR